MNSVTTITNATNGAITRITVIHRENFDYRWLMLAMIAAGLIAWGLRKVFWRKDSN